MNNAFKSIYNFDRMTKEEIFQTWEYFLNEEKNRKYSPCIDFDCGNCQSYVSNYKAFKLFVNNILKGFLGTVKEYCKIYGVSEEYFKEAHDGEYTVIRTNSIGEETITEKEIATIFKIKYAGSSSLNWCEIVRNFSPEEGDQPALPAKGENHE